MTTHTIDAVKFQEALDAMCADKDKRIDALESEVAELTRKYAERDLRFRSCDAYVKESQVRAVEREGWVSVPQTVLMTIARLLANEMNQCVESGANSVSMPDDLVELAVWLSAAPTYKE